MKKIDKWVKRPQNSIETISETASKERLTGAISFQEIRKLKKVLKSKPESIWKYLLKKEN